MDGVGLPQEVDSSRKCCKLCHFLLVCA